MLESVTIHGRVYHLAPLGPIDISIPLVFNGPQPNAYGVSPATSEACVSADLIGDTREGGSCNFEQYTLIPHCNGTHTECVGHITRQRISVRDSLQEVIFPARLVTVAPCYAAETNDAYSIPFEAADRVITRSHLETAGLSLKGDTRPASRPRALVVRTLPNDDRKLSRRYVDAVPPYFTTEATELIVAAGFEHLVVDLPSIDRLYDEGKLSNHRIFWRVAAGKFEIDDDTRRKSTITELVYVPNRIEDGLYLLNLQIAPFATDASPSRPLLFQIAKN